MVVRLEKLAACLCVALCLVEELYILIVCFLLGIRDKEPVVPVALIFGSGV